MLPEALTTFQYAEPPSASDALESRIDELFVLKSTVSARIVSSTVGAPTNKLLANDKNEDW
jgi:hypothetical protein